MDNPSKIQAVLIDTQRKTAETVQIEPTLTSLYKVLGCQVIEAAKRNIRWDETDEKTKVIILCDGEALLKVHPGEALHWWEHISARDPSGHPMFIGNLLVVSGMMVDSRFTGLTDEEAVTVLSHVVRDGTHPTLYDVSF